MTFAELKAEKDKWDSALNDNDSRKFWNDLVNWKGEYIKKDKNIKPNMKDCELYFENLHASTTIDEKAKIMRLNSNMYMPCLDDPISVQEIRSAHKQLK